MGDRVEGEVERVVYRTSIMRASSEASRASSFSSDGGRASALRETFRRSAAWISDCGALSESRREVKRFGGRANRRL
jgi:hypothetical protein